MAAGRADPAAQPRRPYAAPRLIQWTEAGLQEAGHLWLRVQGASMLPFLQEGDRLLLLPLSDVEPRMGDLLVFVQGEHLVVHRLLGRDGDRLRLAGDALGQADPSVDRDALLGRASTLVCRWGRADLDQGPWPAFQALLAALARRRLAGGWPGRVAARLQNLLAAKLPPLLARGGGVGGQRRG